MIARLGAKAVLLAVGLGMAFFGIGLLGSALAESLKALFGVPGALAIAGGVLLLPPLFWALAKLAFRPAKPPPSGLSAVLVAALAKELPWMAVAGAGLSGLAQMIFRRKTAKK